MRYRGKWITPGVPDVRDEIGDPAPESDEPRRGGRVLQSAKTALVTAAFDACTTPQVRRRLLSERGLAVVVTVPNASWVKPISGHLSQRIDGEHYPRDGSQRHKGQSSTDNEDVASALAQGRSVIGVSQAPERFLPSILVNSADIQIRIESPNSATITKAMRLCLRGPFPSELPIGLGIGLDFNEIVAAMRQNSTPAEAVQRMQSASQARLATDRTTVLPELEEAVFYGEARDWGLTLAADVTAARAGLDWSHIDRGAVFYGEPGTGKSWLVRIIARACGLPIIEASVAELFTTGGDHLGSVIKVQRSVFDRAAAQAPCILFWDELDAMPNRATLSPRNRDYWLPIVDDFLLQVSTAPPGVIIIGATNQIADVDSALLRPGRLERKIEVKAPGTAEGLAMILRFHLGNELADTDLVPVARLGLGATAAVAMDWVRQARRTARTAKRDLVPEDLLTAIAPPDLRTPAVLRQSAVHEAAHAVAAIALAAERVEYLSLIPTSESGGRMRLVHSAAPDLYGREALEKLVIVRLAGRAAETVLLGAPSAGAGGGEKSDLAVATHMIAAMHSSLGLGGSLLYRASRRDPEELLQYDTRLREIVEQDLQKLSQRAEFLVRQHRAAVEAVARALIIHRYLTGDEVKKLVDLS
jgi:cell division protease FtsH